MKEEKKQLFVGAGKAALTYPEGFFPHRSFRGRYFNGVLEDIYARAIVICREHEKMVFVGIEAGDVGDDWIEAIARTAGVSAEYVFITASHTHAAPHIGGFWPEDVVDVDMGNQFKELCRGRVLEAVKAAMEAVQPAVMSVGTARCDINVNRDYKYTGTDGKINVPYIQAPNPEGISDKNVYIVQFQSAKNELLACMFNYAVHSCVTFYQTWEDGEGMLVNGDIAGRAMKYVEDRRKNCVAMFTMGACADQSPKYLANRRVFDGNGNASWEYYGGKEGIALMDAQAVSLGAAVMAGLEKCRVSPGTAGIRAVTAEITLESKLEGTGNAAQKHRAENDYASQYKETIDKDFQYIRQENIDMPLFMAAADHSVFVGIPAEIVTKTGIRIREIVKSELGMDAIIISQCNNAYSYITDDEGYRERTFEAFASHFMPGTEARILKGVRELAEKLKKGGSR